MSKTITKNITYCLSLFFLFLSFSHTWAQDEFQLEPLQDESVDQKIEEFKRALELEENGESKELPENPFGNALPKIEEKEAEPQGLSKEDSNKISRFFEEAAKNYEEILSNRPQAEVNAASRRIGTNKELLQSNKAKLNDSESALRKLKLEYIRRFLIIKNAHKNNSFDENTYNRELAKLAKQYEHRVRSLSEDVVFYNKEVDETQDRLKALEELNRINKIIHHKDIIAKPEKPKKPLTELEKMVNQLQSIGCFEVNDVWTSPDIK